MVEATPRMANYRTWEFRTEWDGYVGGCDEWDGDEPHGWEWIGCDGCDGWVFSWYFFQGEWEYEEARGIDFVCGGG